jgi:putative transposase
MKSSRLSYKYRLQLTKNQIKALEKVFNFCCFLYNSALNERISHYRHFGKGISCNSQQAWLPIIKELFGDQTDRIHSQTLQDILKRLDKAYKAFFRRVAAGETPGFPRFKSQDSFSSICFPQCDLSSGGVKLLPNNKLQIKGIPGEVKVG